MKTITCKQLGGACNKKFQVHTFEEAAELSKKHGMEMYQKNDEDHKKVMENMRNKMQDADAMQKWLDEKRAEFDALPDES